MVVMALSDVLHSALVWIGLLSEPPSVAPDDAPRLIWKARTGHGRSESGEVHVPSSTGGAGEDREPVDFQSTAPAPEARGRFVLEDENGWSRRWSAAPVAEQGSEVRGVGGAVSVEVAVGGAPETEEDAHVG